MPARALPLARALRGARRRALRARAVPPCAAADARRARGGLLAVRGARARRSGRHGLRLWRIAGGESFAGRPIDDTNVPPMPPVDESKGANEWMTPAKELAAFRIDPRFEVNLFASEEQFPDMAKPIQMRWDARGRLWVSCVHDLPARLSRHASQSRQNRYSRGHRRRRPRRQVQRHSPTESSTFRLASSSPTAVESTSPSSPTSPFLQDTDGDGQGRYVHRVLFSGFGTEDSHHSLHDFIRTPDGDLLFRESIFQNSPGRDRLRPGARAQLVVVPARTRTSRSGITAFGSYPNTNPWGVTFTDVGPPRREPPDFRECVSRDQPTLSPRSTSRRATGSPPTPAPAATSSSTARSGRANSRAG